MSKKVITILVPAYNEQAVIALLVERLNSVSTKLKKYNFEFLFVDDGSSDKTAEMIKKIAEKDKTHEWQLNDQEQMVIADMDAIYKVWEEDGRFSGFSMTENEANKAHRDWQFILQEQDAKALLAHACDQFSYELYHPIFLHQQSLED